MNVFESIMTGLNEAVDHETGKNKARTMKITVEPVPRISAEEIKLVRSNAKLTQSIFDEILGVSVKTVEAWESGKNEPIGPARRIISLMQSDPEFVQKYNLIV